MTNAQIRGEAYNGGCLGARGARSWLFVGFVMGFAAVIAACWILFADFVTEGIFLYIYCYIKFIIYVQVTYKKKCIIIFIGAPHHWPGVGLFLQNVFIFLGSLTYKFGRSEDQWG